MDLQISKKYGRMFSEMLCQKTLLYFPLSCDPTATHTVPILSAMNANGKVRRYDDFLRYHESFSPTCFTRADPKKQGKRVES